jgi:radical SAM superfamily enzyme YgiQ (UPF0313 family)
MKIVLIGTYELGRQPFGLASPAAWLTRRGHEVACLDLSREGLKEEALRRAGLIGFYVPMHTAARLTRELIEVLRGWNSDAHFCVFGLYARLNEKSFRKAGADSVLGAEFEEELARLVQRLEAKLPEENGHGNKEGILPRLDFEVPDRSRLPALKKYAHLVMPDGTHRTTGYTEASRGCKHVCRHCPIVPVYRGQFRVVDREVVLGDIRQQVEAGAKHITFGDPDFFNGITHALRIVEKMHEEFPEITYDATIKIEHLKKHSERLKTLKETGCVFVTSAVESLDNAVLEKLKKGHTREDFLQVLEACRRIGLGLQPTFVAFTPWTTAEGYVRLLRTIADLQLAETVAPIQLGIRLLIPAGSRLLELQDIQEIVEPFDETALVYPWKHSDGRMDELAEAVQDTVANAEKQKLSRRETFESIWKLAYEMLGRRPDLLDLPEIRNRVTIPYLNEPWYC